MWTLSPTIAVSYPHSLSYFIVPSSTSARDEDNAPSYWLVIINCVCRCSILNRAPPLSGDKVPRRTSSPLRPSPWRCYEQLKRPLLDVSASFWAHPTPWRHPPTKHKKVPHLKTSPPPPSLHLLLSFYRVCVVCSLYVFYL